MTDIQLSALALAALVIIGVLAYNFFLDWRHKNVAKDLLKRAHPKDVLLEPSVNHLSNPDVFLIDPHFEWSAVLHFKESIALADLFSASSQFLQGIQKPITWVAFDSEQNAWRFVYNGALAFPIEHLYINLQLCNRTGAVTMHDVENFTHFIESLAQHFGAEYELPEINVMEIAQSMDKFCSEVDLEISLKALPEKPYAFDDFKNWAQNLGLQYQNQSGDYALFDSNGNLRYRVEIAAQTGDLIQSLHFILDVPCTVEGHEIFKVMVQDAQNFTQTWGGCLVDDSNVPLNQVALANLAAQYVVLPQEKMKQIGIPAGSPQAKRLFS